MPPSPSILLFCSLLHTCTGETICLTRNTLQCIVDRGGWEWVGRGGEKKWKPKNHQSKTYSPATSAGSHHILNGDLVEKTSSRSQIHASVQVGLGGWGWECARYKLQTAAAAAAREEINKITKHQNRAGSAKPAHSTRSFLPCGVKVAEAQYRAATESRGNYLAA